MESHISIELSAIQSLVDQDGAGILPGDYEGQYRNWRPIRLSEHFTDCNETVYATSQVNLRSGPSTDYDKVGSLSSSQSVTRTGIGTGDYSSWSRIQTSDGNTVYVSSNYVSTTKPVQQQTQTSKSSGSTQNNTSGSSSSSQQSSNNGSYVGDNGVTYSSNPNSGIQRVTEDASSGVDELIESGTHYSGTID